MDSQVLKKEITIDGEYYICTVEKLNDIKDCNELILASTYEVKVLKDTMVIYKTITSVINNDHNNKYIKAIKNVAKEMRSFLDKKKEESIQEANQYNEFRDWDGNCDV